MKYINRNNGAVIDTKSKLGGVWEAVNASQTKPEEKTATKKQTKRTKTNE